MTEEGGEKGGAPKGEGPPHEEPQNEPVDLDQLAPDDDAPHEESQNAQSEAPHDDEPQNEPVDLDQLAPEPEEPVATSQALDDAARAQAMARKLAGGTRRRAALGRTPSASTEAPQTSSSPALVAHPTTSGGGKPAAAVALKAAPPTSPPFSGARRPLVDPKIKKEKPKRDPFYAKIPGKPVLAIVLLAALGVGGWFGWKMFDRSQHADEYAVRDELFQYKFDHSDDHFAKIDAMGTKAVEIAITFLTDPRPVETSFGRSTTTTAELAHMYLIHYAQRVGVDPPAKALDVVKLGGVRMKPEDWSQLKDLWGKWFADVQAKGKAR
jgi:hypothetical protein